jgi:hypothetical protein
MGVARRFLTSIPFRLRCELIRHFSRITFVPVGCPGSAAAAAAGDKESAQALYAKLLEVAGESKRPGVAEAKRYPGDR